MKWTEAQLADWQKRHGVQGAPNTADTSKVPFLPAFGTLKDPFEKMNGLEREYAAHLESEKGHSVVWWAYEAIRLKLADRTTYTPDFVVQRTSGALQIHETKGFLRDDASVKIKVAAAQFPFQFFLVRKSTAGWWDMKEVKT